MFWSKSAATDETAVGSDVEQGVLQPEPVANVDSSHRHSVSEKAEHEAKQPLQPSRQWTGHQRFYIFVMDGVGGMALAGGVNFAISYVMYTTQNTTKNPIRLFQLPNTLAGDAAVTIIVQCILTWFVEMGLVRHDLANRSVQPIGFIPEPSLPWLRWLFFLPRPEVSMLWMLLQQALRGFLLAVVSFLVLWPISVGALTGLGRRQSGGDYLFEDRWTPQVFKLVLGSLLGLLTTPLMAMFWLVKAGWEMDETH